MPAPGKQNPFYAGFTGVLPLLAINGEETARLPSPAVRRMCAPTLFSLLPLPFALCLLPFAF
jgi:hypothetical protein